jgi:trimeric autotransporter adhesin
MSTARVATKRRDLVRRNSPSRTIWPFDFVNDIFTFSARPVLRDHSGCAIAKRAALVVLTALVLQVTAKSGVAQTATPSQTSIVFNPAAVAIAASSAQTLQASFTVSGYSGSFTPTATLHYGLSYTLGAVSCTGGGSSETCTVNITFQPTLPGGRRDALFLMNGTTRLTTVLIYGIGNAPFAMVQPGVITNPIASASTDLYTSIVDENLTVYVLETQANAIVSVTNAGVVTTLPITGMNSPRGLGIDGAGVLYIADQTGNGPTITYDTVQGIQGSIPFPTPAPGYIQDLAVGNTGNVYEANGLGIYTITPSGTSTYTAFNPVLNPGPSVIATDYEDNIFLAGSSLYEISVGSTALTTIGAVGTYAEEGLGLDAADTIYASRYSFDSSDSVAELPASNYTTPIAMLDPSASPLGSSVGPDGTVWVGNYTNLDKVDRSQGVIAFGEQFSGTLSTPQNVGIYNGGNLPLTISNIAISGTGFAMQAATTNNCTGGIVIAPGALCQIAVTLTPPHAGTFSGTVTFTSNSLNTSSTNQSVALSGFAYGVYVTPSPTSLTFAPLTVNTTSEQTIALTNNGDLYSASFDAPVFSSSAYTVGLGTCSTGLAVGSTCQLNVIFAPTAAQTYNNVTVSIPYSSSGGGTAPPPVTFTLNGTGIAAVVPSAVSLTPNPVVFPNTEVGLYNVAEAVLTNSGSTQLTGIAISITGTNASLYSIYPTTTCGTTLAAGASCNIIVHFSPIATGSFPATLSISDSATGSPQATSISAIGTPTAAPQAQFNPVQLNAIAGTGTAPANCVSPAEPGPALQTQLCGPTAVAVDLAGNIYIVEQQENVVKKLDTSGNITTFAGIENTGPGSYSGDNGPANAANLSQPLDVAVDALNNVYISDYGNGRIREVNAATGIITTFVGGAIGQYFNGGTGTGVVLSPAGIAFDPSGNLYIAEPNQQIVVKVTPTGAASLFAGVQTPGGPGTAGYNGDNIMANTAELNFPTSVATDRAGNVYIADSQNYRIRYINENAVLGTIYTVAGNGTQGDTGDGGSSTSAEINPLTIAMDLASDLFISDGSTIREVGGQGTINTFAGGGTGGLGGPATSALLAGVGKPGIDNYGDILIPVSTSPQVLSAGPTGILQFGSQAVGTASAPLMVTIENTGDNYLNDFSQNPLTATGPFSITGGTCGQQTDGGYQPAEGCTLIVTFTPTAAGPQTGSIVVASNALNSPQSILLQGTGTQTTTPTAPQAVLTPSSLSFASTTAGSTAVAQTITLSNPGNAALSVSGISITGANTADFAQTTTCTSTLAAGATCTIAVTFTPASAASFTAAVSVADNASGSPQTAALTGTGTAAPVADFTTSSTTPPQTIAAGASAKYVISVQSTNGAFTGAVTLSATGLPPGATASFAPASVTPGSAGATSTLTIQTAAQAAGSTPKRWPFLPPGITVALVAPLFWRRFRDRKQRPTHRLLLGTLLFALLAGGAAAFMTGCGAGFALPSGGQPASTTYTITVTGTSGSDTHSTTVSLIVQ